MCDKYTISEKIELVTLFSALEDYKEVIKQFIERHPNTSKKPNRSYIWKLVKKNGEKLEALVIFQNQVKTSSSFDFKLKSVPILLN